MLGWVAQNGSSLAIDEQAVERQWASPLSGYWTFWLFSGFALTKETAMDSCV